MNETPEEREARLLAEAEAENASDAVSDFQESLGSKPRLDRTWNIFRQGYANTSAVPRLILMQIERRKRTNKDQRKDKS
jgi:hypothetical protein